MERKAEHTIDNQATHLREYRRWVAWWCCGRLFAAMVLLGSCTTTPTPNRTMTPFPISSPTALPTPPPVPTNTVAPPAYTPTPNAAPVVEPDLRLWHYGFIGQNMVWLLASDRLLLTTDNGQHWGTVYKAELSPLDQATFIDEQHGWLAVDGMVKATTDGGQHWVDQRAYNTRDYPVQFSFVSAQQGWFSLGSPLFTTTDGGMTWREIQSNQPVWAAQFFDAQHGWGFLTNEPLMPDPALGYTSDGGQTWQPRTSPPCRWSKGRGMFSFSGPAIGWAACGPDSGSNVTSSDLYQTENGGETWSKVSPLSAGLMDEGVVWADGLFFLDDRHGWIKIGAFAGNTDSSRSLLRATRDGGHTWQSFALLNQGLENMKFASPNRGYALTDVVLLNTQDGGATWAPIYSTMSP